MNLNLVDRLKKEECTGCKSCANICKVEAITMALDSEGFWYPSINKKKCIKCGKCVLVCPIIQSSASKCEKEPKVYAGWSKNDKVHFLSTSGGLFSEIASIFLENSGYVVGASYNSDFSVAHIMINKKEDLEKLRQSKYVQSDMGNIYSLIKQKLDENIPVLFCGTPCQNAALKLFLSKSYDSLLQIDFICRGVPSPLVFQKYLEMLKKRYQSEIVQVTFKSKYYSWNRFCTKICFSNGKQYVRDRYTDLYMQGYLKYNLYMRPSCHNCHFKGFPRHADLTLGDFWGIARSKPHLDDNRGTSVIMINSQKGELWFERVQKNIYYELCTIGEVVQGNACLLESPQPGAGREKLFMNIQSESFDKLIYKYTKDSFLSKMRLWIRNRIAITLGDK